MSEHKQLKQIGEVRAKHINSLQLYEVETGGSYAGTIQRVLDTWYFIAKQKYPLDEKELYAVGEWLKELNA